MDRTQLPYLVKTILIGIGIVCFAGILVAAFLRRRRD
jgi:hypothetical protein